MEKDSYTIFSRVSQDHEVAVEEHVEAAREVMQGVYALLDSRVENGERLVGWMNKSEDGGIVCLVPRPQNYLMRLHENGDIKPECWSMARNLPERENLAGWEYLEVSRMSIDGIKEIFGDAE